METYILNEARYAPPPPDLHRLSGPTILFVDDEEDIVDLVRTVLERDGYNVLTAANGDEALEVYRKRQSEISLVILDMVMPGMSGLQCFKELLKINSRVGVVIGSGDSEALELSDPYLSGARAILKKPFRIKQLKDTVKQALDTDELDT